MRGFKGKLLEKSIEAYILSLETVNRLSIRYRIETFCYLICNAWELMLKAKLLSDANNDRKVILYPKKRGEKTRSLALSACVGRIFTDVKSPTRRNIELIENLRDESTHLVISKVPKEVLCLFQANVLNYHRYLQEWFQVSLSDRVSVGMMTICYDFDPEEFDPKSLKLKKELGAETAKYLLKYQAELRKNFHELNQSSEFSIDVQYHLGLVKHLKDADINLVKGNSGTPTQVVKVAKDPSISHPYRQTNVIEEFNKADLRVPKEINKYDVQCTVRSLNIKARPEFYYQGDVPGSPVQYSRDFIDLLISKHEHDSSFFDHMRRKSREIQAQASSEEQTTSITGETVTDTASFIPP